MEIRQLEMFRALVEELHFTRAAARIRCAQSNVTTRIRALEDELGAPLIQERVSNTTIIFGLITAYCLPFTAYWLLDRTSPARLLSLNAALYAARKRE